MPHTGGARRLVTFAGRASLGWSAVVILACIPANARQQQKPGQQTASQSQSPAQSNQNPTQSQNSGQAQNSKQQQAPLVTDASREELANFDQFLANHPILERELQSNPSLVNDSNYVQSEPDLQIFLSHHPNVKAELDRDPGYLERHKSTSAANRTGISSSNGSPGAQDTERMDQFLNTHHDVAQQLKENPALIDDSTFLAQHQDLQTFLNENPRVWEEVARNPRYLTQHEMPSAGAPEHHDSAKPSPVATNYIASNPPPSHPPSSPADPVPNSRPSSTSSRAVNPGSTSSSHAAPSSGAAPFPARSNRGVAPEDVARMNQFLEDHHDIAKQLEKDPLLVTDHKFLDKHKDLRRFFDENVRLREVFADNPQFFTARSGNLRSAGPIGTDPGAELTDRDLAEMEKFLQKHKDIARQLRTNAWMGKEPQYLQHHKDLRRFFDEHAHVQEEFDENPGAFMRRQGEFEGRANVQLVNR